MAYTIKQARPVLLDYLGLTESTANYITDTDNWGILFEKNGQKYVIFIMPLGENTSSPKIYFDIRDSGAEKFVAAWKYAEQNNYKFFCLGVKDESQKYKNHVISVEADIHTVLKVSGLENGRRSGAGTQLNVPASLIPKGNITRAKSNKFDIFFAVINKDYIFTYLEVFDNRLFQFINSTSSSSSEDSSDKPRNRIIFGAPGTGKSYQLKKESEVFTNQEEIKTDITTQIQAEVNAARDKKNFKALYNAIGIKYAKELPDTNKDIRAKYGENTYEIYVGVKSSKVIDKFQEKKSAFEKNPDYSYDDILKTELDSITSAVEQNANALGFVFGNYLCDFTLNEIIEKYELNPKESKGYWLQKGAQAFVCYEEQKEQKQIKYLERVTFHPNYSYAQFVGTYKPIQNPENPDEIRYEYVPGPFMRTYINAVNHKGKNFLLLIEEINRANVAAVFGDIFQLLDRKSDGTSEYPITVSEDMKKYLVKNGIKDDEISIPANMYIWATMNSADQGVLPMDAAFKRRWNFEYINIDEGSSDIDGVTIPVPNGTNEDKSIKYTYVDWNKLRIAINTQLKTVSGINEDKLLGPFFIGDKAKIENAAKEPEQFCKSFKSKVLMYLFEDVVKMQPGELFDSKEGINIHYSDICKDFDSKGLRIFLKSVYEQFPEFANGDSE